MDVPGFSVARKRVMGSAKTLDKTTGPVLYWMSRDQRVQGIAEYPHLSSATTSALAIFLKLTMTDIFYFLKEPILLCDAKVTLVKSPIILKYEFIYYTTS